MPNPDRYDLPVVDPDTRQTCEPHHVVALYQESGDSLRLVLDDDAGGKTEGDEPNPVVERHADKWLILVHPNGSEKLLDIEIYAASVVVRSESGTVLLDEAYEPPNVFDAYVRDGGSWCPYCGSKDIESGPISADGRVACSEVICLHCGKEWRDEYMLSSAGPQSQNQDQPSDQ